MKRTFLSLFSSLLLSAVCLTHTAFAATAQEIKRLPGISMTGLIGHTTMGYADMMAPLVGHPHSFFYVNPQALLHDGNQYTLSLGGGWRRLSEHAGILGAYLFGDYNHSPHGNAFWFVSPGVERLGNIVDMRANLYIPASEKRKDFSAGLGETLGTYDYVTFAGHSKYDRMLRSFESTGTGADVEIGARIPITHNPKIYVGGYYFAPQDALEQTRGLTARLELPLTNQLTVMLSDSYDHAEHNTARIGLQYAFGGRRNSRDFKGDLAERMLDPIQRNIIATAGPANTGQPIAQTYNKPEETVQVLDHIAFFNAASRAPGDGSYENPFQQITQADVDAAHAGGYHTLYVNTGVYHMGDILTPVQQAPPIGTHIHLTNDTLVGRQSYNGRPFVQAATGDNRPLFEFHNAPTFAPDPGRAAGFILHGTYNRFDSVRLEGGQPETPPGLVPDLGTGILIAGEGSTAFSIHNAEVRHFSQGLSSTTLQNLDLTVTDSQFHENRQNGVNIFVFNHLGMRIQNSQFEGNGTNGARLRAENNLTVQVQNARFDGNAESGLDASAAGSGTSTIDMSHASFDGNTTGLYLSYTGEGTFTTQVQNSSITNNTVGVFGQTEAGTFITRVQNSSITNNTLGVFGQNNGCTGNMTIDLRGATFSGNTATTNQTDGDRINWILPALYAQRAGC